MSEILRALESKTQVENDAEQASPDVDMRSARLLPESSGSREVSNLPAATVTALHIELGDEETRLLQESISLEQENAEAQDVRGLLTHLLEYPGRVDGVVPDSWGPQQCAEYKRVSPAVDSIYTLNPRVEGLIDSIREDFKKILKVQQT